MKKQNEQTDNQEKQMSKTRGLYLGSGMTLLRRLKTLNEIAPHWGYNAPGLIRGIGRGEFDMDWVRNPPFIEPDPDSKNTISYHMNMGADPDAVVTGLKKEAERFNTTAHGMLRLLTDGQIEIVGRRSSRKA